MRGHADLLGLEVIDELLVVRRDELAVIVGRHQADGRRGLGERQPDAGLDDGVTPHLGEIRGESHEIVDELRVFEGVEQHRLRIADEHRDRPRSHRDRADRRRRLGLHERLALLEEAGQARSLVRIGHAQLRQPRLVLGEDVLVDRRHDPVGILHAAAERLRFLREVVVGEHDIGLVALVVVQHRLDGPRHVGAVLLDRETVERSGERRDDRIDGHAVGERALVGRHHTIAIGVCGRAFFRLPHAVGLHVPWRQLRLVLHELRDRIADAAGVRAAQAVEDLLHLRPRYRERHLVVLGLAEDAIPRAGEDHLRPIGAHRRHDDVRAHDTAAERGRELAAALPQRGLREAHHLRRIGVDADEVGLERRPVEGRDEQRAVLALLESIDGCLRPLAGLLRLGVHALAERAGVVQVGGLLEAEGGDAQRADGILAREDERPPIAPGHVDDLTVHGELLEVAGRAPRAVRDRFAGTQHPDRDRERLRPDVRLELAIRCFDVDHAPSPPATVYSGS